VNSTLGTARGLRDGAAPAAALDRSGRLAEFAEFAGRGSVS
jgi:hypothetical protein